MVCHVKELSIYLADNRGPLKVKASRIYHSDIKSDFELKTFENQNVQKWAMSEFYPCPHLPKSRAFQNDAAVINPPLREAYYTGERLSPITAN